MSDTGIELVGAHDRADLAHALRMFRGDNQQRVGIRVR
jgi:hypothetical protein